jgi:hypothetical protein
MKKSLKETVSLTLTLEKPLSELTDVTTGESLPFTVEGEKTRFNVLINAKTFPMLSFKIKEVA